MRGPGRVLAGAAALWIFAACLDVTSPVTGIASITSVLLPSPAFGDTVRGKGDTTVQSYVVRYQIVRAPPSTNAEPTVVLSDASGHDSSLFVTDGSGHAAAHLRIRTRSIAPTLFGGATDSAFVVAHVQYRGDALRITPTDTFKIAIRRNIGP